MLTLQTLERQSAGVRFFTEMGISLLPGSLMKLSGANASGKTWLLEMIAGQSTVAQGSILFAEQETRGDSEFFNDLLYLPECAGLSAFKPRLTVRKQVERLAGKAGHSLVDAALHYFGLTALAEQRVGALTPGQLKRIWLTPMVTHTAAIWLLDRPFSALDDQALQAAETLIAGRCQQHGIVILVDEARTRLNPHATLEMKDFLFPV